LFIVIIIIISLPVSDSLRSGLMFYRRCLLFVYFFHFIERTSRCIGRMADQHKILHSDQPNFIIPVQNFGGSPPKMLGAKNMQNVARFWMTSKFGGEYLRNG